MTKQIDREKLIADLKGSAFKLGLSESKIDAYVPLLALLQEINNGKFDAPEGAGWKTIETAPKDQEVLLFFPAEEEFEIPEKVAIGYWDIEYGNQWEGEPPISAEGWWSEKDSDYFDNEPTHWMPYLPPAPEKDDE